MFKNKCKKEAVSYGIVFRARQWYWEKNKLASTYMVISLSENNSKIKISPLHKLAYYCGCHMWLETDLLLGLTVAYSPGWPGSPISRFLKCTGDSKSLKTNPIVTMICVFILLGVPEVYTKFHLSSLIFFLFKCFNKDPKVAYASVW